MSEMGKAMMGTGEADGDDRAKRAAEAAISNPLLDDVSMKGARGVLINITGGNDMTLFEVDEAANRIGDEVDPDANIIFGSAMDPDLEGRLRVSVVATGIDLEANVQPHPVLKIYSEPALKVVTETPAPALKPVPALQDAPARAAADDAEAAAEPPERKPMAATAEAEIGAPETESDDSAVPDAVPVAEETPQARPVVAETPAETPFIPPPPAEPNSPRHAGLAPDPFKEADLINGGQPAAERRRGPSLFQRMKASSRARRETPETVENQDKQAAMPAPAPVPAATAVAPAAPEPAAPPAQTRLDGVDRIAHAKAAVQSEEDLLEIPAFLRRQAN
jgi:cell division protein FtsZ